MRLGVGWGLINTGWGVGVDPNGDFRATRVGA